MIERDIATVTAEDIMAAGHFGRGQLDILDGSPPCQGFSTAGKRRFDDPRNTLFREFVRLIADLQPKVFVMENVSGMVKGKMKLAFKVIMEALKATGYRVRCQLLNAMYYGVPQSRERLIWIGVRPSRKRRGSRWRCVQLYHVSSHPSRIAVSARHGAMVMNQAPLSAEVARASNLASYGKQ